MLENLKNIINLIDISIKKDANNLITWWNIIQDNFDKNIDEYRNIINNSQKWLEEYTYKIIQETQINSLKIKYTNISGYFIEIPLSQKDKIPAYFIQKQILINAARYTTKELWNFEEKILSGESYLFQKEYEIFNEICGKVYNEFESIKKSSSLIAKIDFYTNLAYIAYENNYSRPKINTNSTLEIFAWRHPIIEKIEKNFITNELFMDDKKFLHLITWPNMWWKSTYLRQNALIIIMSHIWSFVPCKEANICLMDKIFSRVGASDNLFFGNSTFMVEMQEMANILNNATKNSFIIIDEVWRWTSTYDWMSLAWAILKNIEWKIKAKTLFATHYHEIVDESKKLKWRSNFCVAVWENDDNIVFLRKIIPWSIKKSYGIQVAKIAWINNEIINDALDTLKKYEKSNNQLSLWQLWSIIEEKIVYKETKSQIEEEIKNIDINNLTPLEALNMIYKFKNNIN